jgi:DNA repair exonuclease SbcCD ATPase subunit
MRGRPDGTPGKTLLQTNTMSTLQITLADCLTEINNALNYWYPLPVRDSKLDEEFGSDRPYGASREECDARHVRLFQFRDRLQQQLRASGKDAAFDLAMAMAELARVTAERDRFKAERDDWELRHRQQRQEIVASRDAMDNARQSLRAAEQDVTEIDTLCNDFRRANSRLVADLAAATQRADTAEAILRAKA